MANTGKRKMSADEGPARGAARAKRGRRREKARSSPARREPLPKVAKSSQSTSPSPGPEPSVHEFLEPPHPKPTRWCCYGCNLAYSLEVTSRCILCGSRVCLKSTPGRPKTSRPVLDEPGWHQWTAWQRWRRLVEEDPDSSGGKPRLRTTPTSTTVSRDKIDVFHRRLGELEHQRVLRLRNGMHNCFEDCHLPKECMQHQLKKAYERSSLSPTPSLDGAEPLRAEPLPTLVIPDSPRSPPPSDDEDEDGIQWVEVDEGAAPRTTEDETADCVRTPASRKPLPSGRVHKVHREDGSGRS